LLRLLLLLPDPTPPAVSTVTFFLLSMVLVFYKTFVPFCLLLCSLFQNHKQPKSSLMQVCVESWFSCPWTSEKIESDWCDGDLVNEAVLGNRHHMVIVSLSRPTSRATKKMRCWIYSLHSSMILYLC
jgi:hypothetical protein